MKMVASVAKLGRWWHLFIVENGYGRWFWASPDFQMIAWEKRCVVTAVGDYVDQDQLPDSVSVAMEEAVYGWCKKMKERM